MNSKLCLNDCGKPVATGSNRTGKFCSRSCSNSYHNRTSPKRQAQPKNCSWDGCQELIYRPAARCDKHKGLRSSTAAKTTGLYMSQNHHQSLREAKEISGLSGDEFAKFLRHQARVWARTNLPHTECSHCGYNKTTVLAHIKALKDFSDSDSIQSTYKNNLARLCPNCHWEFDNGLIRYVPETGFEPA